MSPFKWLILFALVGLSKAASAKRRALNKAEQMMLQDLKQDTTSGRFIKTSYFGSKGQLKKPRCFFEHFTASCCLQMKYRTQMVNGSFDEKDFKPQFHRACIEVGLNITQLKVFVRARYDTIKLHNGEKESYDIIEKNQHFGKLCWFLPPPVDSLELCIWIYHLDIKPAVPSAEFCIAFVITEMLKIQFDCLHWNSGEFSLNRTVDIPQKDRGQITLFIGQNGFKFKIENKFIKQALAVLKKTWSTIKKLFQKTKDHEKFLMQTADNSDLK